MAFTVTGFFGYPGVVPHYVRRWFGIGDSTAPLFVDLHGLHRDWLLRLSWCRPSLRSSLVWHWWLTAPLFVGSFELVGMLSLLRSWSWTWNFCLI